VGEFVSTFLQMGKFVKLPNKSLVVDFAGTHIFIIDGVKSLMGDSAWTRKSHLPSQVTGC